MCFAEKEDLEGVYEKADEGAYLAYCKNTDTLIVVGVSSENEVVYFYSDEENEFVGKYAKGIFEIYCSTSEGIEYTNYVYIITKTLETGINCIDGKFYTFDELDDFCGGANHWYCIELYKSNCACIQSYIVNTSPTFYPVKLITCEEELPTSTNEIKVYFDNYLENYSMETYIDRNNGNQYSVFSVGESVAEFNENDGKFYVDGNVYEGEISLEAEGDPWIVTSELDYDLILLISEETTTTIDEKYIYENDEWVKLEKEISPVFLTFELPSSIPSTNTFYKLETNLSSKDFEEALINSIVYFEYIENSSKSIKYISQWTYLNKKVFTSFSTSGYLIKYENGIFYYCLLGE